MSIQIALHHRTEYQYDRPITLLPQVLRLRPAPHCRTPILGYSLRVVPKDHFINWQQDHYSNYLARMVFPKPTREFVVEVDLLVDMVHINPFDFFVEEKSSQYPFRYEQSLLAGLKPFLEITDSGPKLLSYVKGVRKLRVGMIDYLVEINQRLQKDIRYITRMEPGIQTCEETLQKRSGSCRDSAWLLVQILRQLGLAARFVSGYLIQLAPDVPPLEGPRGPSEDFTDLHAWAEVFIPGAGWVGLDPTSGLLAAEGHIPLACTADPMQAAPITGSFQFSQEDENDELETEFRFDMTVRRMVEKPRVTKPYTDPQWHEINQLGMIVDRNLQENDVRLTMGGEPTFVGMDDPDAPEWNSSALGPVKKIRGDELLRRLGDKFANGPLLHFGQGKWYPGESLPRWAFGCYWRKDGQPIWHNPKLIGSEDSNHGFGDSDARHFIERFASHLGVNPNHASAGYEDTWYYLWRENRLPVNVNPLNNKLDDAEERARLARVFEKGLSSVVGFALPISKVHGVNGPVWVSGPWSLRTKNLFLVPGDSPMGFRLPLDSLPWESADTRQTIHEMDPWSIRGSLPISQPARLVMQNGVSHPVQSTHSETSSVVRTAICVEPRSGRLYVFMPPVASVTDYLELVSAVEATAAELQMPVQMEGYPPPYDPRLNVLKVTPDPGVIEVNIHPASNWPELAHNITTLYDEAHHSRLCAEKFMMDGRHSGTGGGNHMILGGSTPSDSPILRRPDLLRSLIAYWHNHPSLSYLFSGLFIGPTSQAPRIDEARNDSLYEMELAFSQIPDHGGTAPWLVDRVFRNLLIDSSGNTHRSEWCIDKLFSPDSSTGRLGLLEFRAFEMPPHARMSLVQHLLVRALVSKFWKTPYKHSLVRWGTELHDRFLLPHFIQQDMNDVLEDLASAGYCLKPEWLAPHFEFRFPFIGQIAHQGVHMELRTAMEVWHVLGEQPGTAGTVRYVDSSLERIQVKVRGMTGDRHTLICNGRKVPLHPTGTNGEFVAGVRFRAWQPPSCLQPTIGVHAPLVFDMVDNWMERSVGGCTYHVSHPGGRSFDNLPINAMEAESRRIARFLPMGHTPGDIKVAPGEILPEFPLTLDLRLPVTEQPLESEIKINSHFRKFGKIKSEGIPIHRGKNPLTK